MYATRGRGDHGSSSGLISPIETVGWVRPSVTRTEQAKVPTKPSSGAQHNPNARSPVRQHPMCRARSGCAHAREDAHLAHVHPSAQ
eukprot:scaffold161878_cov37-Tisochrysis_lutea.AAC.1